MIKAIFLDIDGTIISIHRHAIPQSAIETIREVRRAGIKVFLCTSRAKQFMANIHGIEADGMVCLTGANCVDADGKDIGCAMMHPTDVANAIGFVQTHNLPLVGIASQHIYIHLPQHSAVRNSFATGGLTLSDIEPYSDFPDLAHATNPHEAAAQLGIMQFTAYCLPGEEEARFLTLMPHCHTERWTIPFVDIVGNGINKALGIEVMARHFDFNPTETMAVGDGYNDVPMIEYAAIGVAMGNASNEVKRHADYVTADVDADGLSQALQRFALRQS